MRTVKTDAKIQDEIIFWGGGEVSGWGGDVGTKQKRKQTSGASDSP